MRSYKLLLVAGMSFAALFPVMGKVADIKETEAKKLGDVALQVDDPGAKSKKAIEVKCAKPSGVTILGSEKIDIPLAGNVTVTTLVRGKDFIGVSEQVRIIATLTSQTSGERYSTCGFVQGTRVRPDKYVPLPLTVKLPGKPDTYTVEVSLNINAVDPQGTAPTAYFSEIIVSAHDASDAYVSRIEPDKSCYRPGQEIKTVVTVVNPSASAFSGKLNLRELIDIDGIANEKTENVEVPAGAFKEITVSWKAGKDEAGREIRAELQDSSGKTIDASSDIYGVAKDPSWLSTISLYGLPEWFGGWIHPVFYIGPNSYSETLEAVSFYKSRRVQRCEFFSWSYNELAQFMPPSDEEPYLGNESIWWQSFKKFKEQVGMLKNIGATPITYIQGLVWGPAAYKLFQEHPEWFMFTKNGENVGSYDMEWRSLYGRRREFEFQQKKTPFFYSLFNPVLPETRKHIANQIIRLAKEMGFEGARWDVWSMEVKRGNYDFSGNEIVKTDEEADKMSAESLKAVKELVRKEVPDFTWGYNYAGPEENTTTPLLFTEKCRGGGWLLDEIVCTYHEKTSPFHIWDAYAERIVSWGDKTRQLGGIYNPFGFRRQGGKYPVDKLYESIFRMVAGSRVDQGLVFTSNLSGKIGRLDLLPFRFSDFYLSWNLRLQPVNQTVIKVEAPETIWWKNMVFENKSRAGKIQKIVHIVNSPVSKEAEENPTSSVRKPVKNIKVSCGKVAGFLPSKAWILTAEPLTPDDEPEVKAVPLKIAKAGGGVSVTVPSVQFLKTVVFEF
ncbi:MAG: hypothetical protein L6437_13240 [Kiritimatiellae bacterium]|nr:hypothetical protein [Kiritimatiellia bacterium]